VFEAGTGDIGDAGSRSGSNCFDQGDGECLSLQRESEVQGTTRAIVTPAVRSGMRAGVFAGIGQAVVRSDADRHLHAEGEQNSERKAAEYGPRQISGQKHGSA
jgi:hypothetical protein